MKGIVKKFDYENYQINDKKGRDTFSNFLIIYIKTET